MIRLIELRPYQHECIEKIETADGTGTHRQLVALPTGTGKTVIFCTVAKKRNGRTLILAHRDELIQQGVFIDLGKNPTLRIQIIPSPLFPPTFDSPEKA